MTTEPTGTITLVVTIQFKPDKEETFLANAANFAEWVHANELGTLAYFLTKHPTREHSYVWVERYRDEAALEAHRTSPQLAEALKVVRECLDGPPELLRLEQVIPG
jgi:quinol monooxygenase YgiN